MIRDPARLAVRKKLPEDHNTIIRYLAYINFYALASRVGKSLHPELKGNAREEFDIRKVHKFYHSAQISVTSGDVIYRYLVRHDMLKKCLGDEELLAIQARDIDFYRKFYHGLSPYAWRSAKLLGNKSTGHVSCITEMKGEVVILLKPITAPVFANNPALYFNDFS